MKAKIMLLSATPITKSPLDLVSQYEVVHLNDEVRRLQRNCDWQERWIGSKRIMECVGWKDEAVSKEIHGARMIRHTKADVFGDELPPMRHNLIDVDVPESLLRARVCQIMGKDKTDLQAMLAEEAVEEYFTEGRSQPNALGMRIILATLEASALLKAKDCAEYVATLAETEQVVVFAHNVNVLERINEALAEKRVEAVVCHGQCSEQELVDRTAHFKQGDVPVLLGSYGTMATGIDLTNSRHIVIAQQSFDPAVMQQAYNRIHRIGQKGMTQCDTLIARGRGELHLIEANLARNHRRKRNAADGAGLEGSLATAVS